MKQIVAVPNKQPSVFKYHHGFFRELPEVDLQVVFIVPLIRKKGIPQGTMLSILIPFKFKNNKQAYSEEKGASTKTGVQQIYLIG